LLDGVTDTRKRPRIATRVVMRAVLVMMLARQGSLNALEQTRKSSVWRRWLGGKLPSADTLGRVCNLADVQTIREVNYQVYSQLKRAKALAPPAHGLMLVVLDGHE